MVGASIKALATLISRPSPTSSLGPPTRRTAFRNVLLYRHSNVKFPSQGKINTIVQSDPIDCQLIKQRMMDDCGCPTPFGDCYRNILGPKLQKARSHPSPFPPSSFLPHFSYSFEQRKPSSIALTTASSQFNFL